MKYGDKPIAELRMLLKKLRSPVDYGDRPVFLAWELLTQRNEAADAIEQLLEELTKATKGEGDVATT